MPSTFYALSSVIIVSLVSFVGALILAMHTKKLRGFLFILVALAIGAMLGDAFLHLIPEAFEKSLDPQLTSLWIIIGLFSFFLLEKILFWHHHHVDHEDKAHKEHKPLGKIILVSDGLHNFIDGIIIGASYTLGIEIGIATTIAIILHEIPQEMGDFGVLLYSGYSKFKALMFNFISASFAIAGTLFFLIGQNISHALLEFVTPFAAGAFIYIASADLIPELHKHEGVRNAFLQILFISIGIGAMYILLFWE